MSTLSKSYQYAISGITGWLGRALALELTENLGIPESTIIGIGSSNREVRINGKSFIVATWENIENFNLNLKLFAHYGFLTRDKVKNFPITEYLNLNSQITSNAVSLITKYDPESILSISSGAVYKGPNYEKFDDNLELNPYGILKQREENALREAAEKKGANLVINRLFGLAGKNIQNTKPYALAEFIKCALENEPIRINATHLVYRRYTYDFDLTSLMLALSAVKKSEIFDSGGELVELRDLAARVVKVLNSSSEILSNATYTQDPDLYYSRRQDYENLYALHVKSEPLSLDSQIQATAEGLIQLKSER